MDILIDISGVQIETERMLLREWRETDLEDLFAYASVEGVGEMAGWPHHTSEETSMMILDSFIQSKNVFAVVCKESGKVMGSLGLHNSWGNDEPIYEALRLKEIGYVLGKEYWGKGLMPEAVKGVIQYYFDQDVLDAFTIGHFNVNHQSRRVIEKIGFEFVKESTYYSSQLDKSFQDMKYILLKSSF